MIKPFAFVSMRFSDEFKDIYEFGMKRACILLAFSLTALPFCLPAQAAKWKVVEQIKHYPISGTTGRALYISIGRNGPRIGGGRATIAHTNWDLRWRRKYRPRNKACTLVSARPFFTITYTLPKPTAKLPRPVARQWNTFAKGIAMHEKVHGTYARAMVGQIIDATVNLTVENDPKCLKIRAEVLAHVKAAYSDYKAKGRAFDRAEMTVGGNVRGLVEGLLRNK